MRRTDLPCPGMLRFDTPPPYSVILDLVVAVDSDLPARRTRQDRTGQGGRENIDRSIDRSYYLAVSLTESWRDRSISIFLIDCPPRQLLMVRLEREEEELKSKEGLEVKARSSLASHARQITHSARPTQQESNISSEIRLSGVPGRGPCPPGLSY